MAAVSGQRGICKILENKEKVYEVSPLVKGIDKKPDNLNFEVFYLEEVTASVSKICEPVKVFGLKGS